QVSSARRPSLICGAIVCIGCRNLPGFVLDCFMFVRMPSDPGVELVREGIDRDTFAGFAAMRSVNRQIVRSRPALYGALVASEIDRNASPSVERRASLLCVRPIVHPPHPNI